MNVDYETFQSLLAFVGAPGGLLTVTIMVVRDVLRRRRGELTRAQVQTAESARLSRQNARLYDYIDSLRNQWPEGHDIPPWPRGLKPHE